MGLTMREKQAVTSEVRKRYQKAGRKEKTAMLNELIQTTGYNQKYTPRVRNKRERAGTILFVKGTAVKLNDIWNGKESFAFRKTSLLNNTGCNMFAV
jgi:hypothetical protein